MVIVEQPFYSRQDDGRFQRLQLFPEQMGFKSINHSLAELKFA